MPNPSQEMRLVVPNSQRINRGGMVLSELVESCRAHDFTDVVILHEHRGEPGEPHPCTCFFFPFDRSTQLFGWFRGRRSRGKRARGKGGFVPL